MNQNKCDFLAYDDGYSSLPNNENILEENKRKLKDVLDLVFRKMESQKSLNICKNHSKINFYTKSIDNKAEGLDGPKKVHYQSKVTRN